MEIKNAATEFGKPSSDAAEVSIHSSPVESSQSAELSARLDLTSACPMLDASDWNSTRFRLSRSTSQDFV